MLVSSKEMLEKAKVEGYAIPSPDYWDFNSAKAFVKAAEEMNKPVILSYAAIEPETLTIEDAALIGTYVAKNAKVDVALHLDHGKDFETCKKAIELGFSSVMIDASAKSFEENVRITKEVVDYAHKYNVPVEAEIGHVGTDDETMTHVLNHSTYTDPDMAKEFVEKTGVDSLAISIGTSHGAYKNGTPHINFDILNEIKVKVDIPLVLHGGSGTGDENLNKCAKLGICKVNIFTDFVSAAIKMINEEKPQSLLKLIDRTGEVIIDVAKHSYEVLNCK